MLKDIYHLCIIHTCHAATPDYKYKSGNQEHLELEERILKEPKDANKLSNFSSKCQGLGGGEAGKGAWCYKLKGCWRLAD